MASDVFITISRTTIYGMPTFLFRHPHTSFATFMLHSFSHVLFTRFSFARRTCNIVFYLLQLSFITTTNRLFYRMIVVGSISLHDFFFLCVSLLCSRRPLHHVVCNTSHAIYKHLNQCKLMWTTIYFTFSRFACCCCCFICCYDAAEMVCISSHFSFPFLTIYQNSYSLFSARYC